MKTKMKKYPLLVSMIVSCVLIVASLFILGFFGMNLGTSLGGGSQFEITMPKDVSQTSYVQKVKNAVSDEGFNVETTFFVYNFLFSLVFSIALEIDLIKSNLEVTK